DGDAVLAPAERLVGAHRCARLEQPGPGVTDVGGITGAQPFVAQGQADRVVLGGGEHASSTRSVEHTLSHRDVALHDAGRRDDEGAGSLDDEAAGDVTQRVQRRRVHRGDPGQAAADGATEVHHVAWVVA